jgi:hypothetical protein
MVFVTTLSSGSMQLVWPPKVQIAPENFVWRPLGLSSVLDPEFQDSTLIRNFIRASSYI